MTLASDNFSIIRKQFRILIGNRGWNIEYFIFTIASDTTIDVANDVESIYFTIVLTGYTVADFTGQSTAWKQYKTDLLNMWLPNRVPLEGLMDGPQGITGLKGPQGVLGPQGPNGFMGPQGIIGPQGNDGVQGEQGLISDIGPQSVMGPQGFEGMRGPQGQGPQGVVPPNILGSSVITSYDYELVTTDSTVLSTTGTSIIDTSNSEFIDLTLPDADEDGTRKEVRLLYPRGMNATIKCTIGIFKLTPHNYKRSLIFHDSAWHIADGTQTNNDSFFVGRQLGEKLVGTGFSSSVFGVRQGTSVALSADGNTLAIGGNQDDTRRGAVWIFTRNGNTLVQQGEKLVGTGYSGNGINQGTSMALSADGNTLAVGAVGDDGLDSNMGATWIFTRSGTIWSQQGEKLVGTGFSGVSINQGTSIALSADGNTLAVGAWGDDGLGSNVGATWIFTRNGTIWSQQGEKLVGTGFTGNSQQGRSVALSADGNTLAIGGPLNNNLGSNVGATWIFTRSGTTWTQQQKVIGTGFSVDSQQGSSVSLSADGNTLAVGGYGDDGFGIDSDIGAAWIFTRSGTVWSQQWNKLIGTGFSGSSQQGFSVSLSADGNTLAVGGYFDALNLGATWVFTRSNNVWSQQNDKLVGTGFSGNSQQGYSVSLSADGNILAVGGNIDADNLGATWVFV